MPYVTSIERFAEKRGKAEGKADALVLILEQHLATAVPADLTAAIQTSRDLGQLEQWMKLAFQVNSLEEFRHRTQL